MAAKNLIRICKSVTKEVTKMASRVKHTIAPVFDGLSEILILGTMPSPASRETGFYYGHPQNRFWRVLSAVYNEETPQTVEEKKAFLLRNRIALWDVLSSCDITGASDRSIRNPVPNDIASLLSKTQIKRVFTTGKKAYALYTRLCLPQTGLEAVLLPSTSPANCAVGIDELTELYKGAIFPRNLSLH